MKKIPTLLLFISILLFACNDSDNNSNTLNNPDTSSIPIIPEVVKVRDKVFSVPSPIQASFLVKDQNISYNNELLNSPDNYVNYLTSFKISLNIGVYGANLGNLFIYDQLSESAQYFSVIKKLSEQIGILNSINQNLLDRIDKNSQNKDSLMFLISDIYKDIDSYLLDNDQEDIGILIITGGWVESLYLLTTIAETYNNPEIIARIGEQKNPLNNLIELLQPYYGAISDEFDYLVEKLIDISIVFDAIDDVYTYQAPDVDPHNKITTINSTTTYNISTKNLELISEKIKDLRSWITE